MIEVSPRLWVGGQAAYETVRERAELEDPRMPGWAIVHAAKEPFHREMLGYTTRAAPKDDPEYLWGIRGNRLILNLVDAADPAYIPESLISQAVAFVELHRKIGNVLVHCNQGRSRSPTIAMLALAPNLEPDYEDSLAAFGGRYPDYAPAIGMRDFARSNWSYYHTRGQE